jgi:phospholipase/carboxylesterase
MSERDADALDTSGISGPHTGQPVVRQGPPLSEADAAVVLLHGRGAMPHGMFGLADEFDADGVTYLAPAASGRTWYPYAFTDPIEDNQPHLSSALDLVELIVETATEAVGRERVALVGFSQGACLASEWVARNADRYGGLVVFSGGLIGPDGTPREYEGSLADGDDGMPVFLGCSDDDPHIPVERVHETRDVLNDLGADVDERIYHAMGHGVNEEEVAVAGRLIRALTDDSSE